MIHVDDIRFDRAYFERCFSLFEQHAVLGRPGGGRVALCTQDAAFSIALCLYARERGFTVFPLPADLPAEAARRRAERSGCSHLLVGPKGEEALEAFERLSVRDDSGVTSEPPSLVQTSSGTTGEPKYIARSWASIDEEIASYVGHFDAQGSTPVVACPVNHSYGLISGVLVALARGREPVVITNPNPKYVLRKVAEASSPLLYASPSLLAVVAMLAREDAPIDAVMTSGTTLPKKVFDSLQRKARHLHQQYGCSEAGCVTLAIDATAADDLGSVLPHVSVTAGRSVASADEIMVRACGKTIATRDLGYLEEGRLHFVSRVDDMINVSGFNVYPAEVEEVVLAIEGVSDAVVYKRAYALGNDQVCLQFVCERPFPAPQVRAWCAARLAAYQVPMRIEQVERIEKLPNGKVNRRALAEAAERRESSPVREVVS
jgi:3,4-dihydroxybenzoate---[aryl-carrier protein] ligase